MKICIIGAGVIGLVTAVVLSDTDHAVCRKDRDSLNIDRLKKYALSNTELSKQLKMVLLRAAKKINRSQPEIYMNILKTIEAYGFKIAGTEGA